MPAQTISWLAWLAQQMSQHAQTDFYLERLDVSWLPPKYFHVCHIAARLLVGLFFGLFGGLTGWQTLRLAGELANQLGSWQIFRLAGELASLLGGWQTLELVGGLVGALISWLVSGQIIEQIINYVSRPTEVITLSWKTILRGLGMVLLIGLPNGLGGWLFVTIENGRLEEKLFVGLGMGLTFGLLAGLFTGLPTQQLNERARAIPNQGISRSRENALRMGLSIGLLACIGGGLVGYLIDELVFGLVHALLFGLSIGLLSALMGGLFAGLHYGGVTYINHYILRLMLSHLGYLPRHYEQFLDVAADCILLQKVGGGYRFIHQEFLKYFALLDTPMPTHKAKAQATQSSSSQTS